MNEHLHWKEEEDLIQLSSGPCHGIWEWRHHILYIIIFFIICFIFYVVNSHLCKNELVCSDMNINMRVHNRIAIIIMRVHNVKKYGSFALKIPWEGPGDSCTESSSSFQSVCIFCCLFICSNRIEFAATIFNWQQLFKLLQFFLIFSNYF